MDRDNFRCDLPPGCSEDDVNEGMDNCEGDHDPVIRNTLWVCSRCGMELGGPDDERGDR